MPSVFDWSTATDTTNGTTDSGISAQEGVAPSAINNNQRVIMARVAALVDQLGAVNQALSADGIAYTLTSGMSLSSLAAGQIVGFYPQLASGTTQPTLDVDGLGAKNIRTGSGASGANEILQAGCYYLAVYDGTYWRLLNAPYRTGAFARDDVLTATSAVSLNGALGDVYRYTTEGPSNVTVTTADQGTIMEAQPNSTNPIYTLPVTSGFIVPGPPVKIYHARASSQASGSVRVAPDAGVTMEIANVSQTEHYIAFGDLCNCYPVDTNKWICFTEKGEHNAS